MSQVSLAETINNIDVGFVAIGFFLCFVFFLFMWLIIYSILAAILVSGVYFILTLILIGIPALIAILS